MPTLKELYEEDDHRRTSFDVWVGNVRLSDVLDIEWQFEFGAVATAAVTVPRAALPASVDFNSVVRIYVGFDGVNAIQFTGKVDSPVYGTDSVRIECVGRSWLLDVVYKRTINVTFVGLANTIVQNLLAQAGIADYVAALPAWTVGSVVPQTLEFQTYGEAIMKVAEVDGSPWYELPSGQVRVEQRDPLPAPTAFREYFSGVLTGVAESQPVGITNAAARPRILQATLRTVLREVCNSITIRGAAVDTVGPEGETNTDVIETSCDGPSPWIPIPPEFRDFTFNNELIDTAAKAGAVCSRYYALKNRLEQRLSLTVDGDPQLFLGATVLVEDPSYTGVTGRWFVYGYSSRLDSGGFSTTLDLRGGGPAAGGSPAIDPFACFVWNNEKVEPGGDSDQPAAKFQQVVPAGTPGGPAGGGLAVIVTFDGRCSTDVDGSIASYAWSDDQGGAGTGPVWQQVYDPAVISSVVVTLIVTDNDGRTDDVIKTVNIKADATTPPDPTVNDYASGGGELLIPTIYCAAGNTAMCSVDGGVSWTDLTPAAAGASGLFISVSGALLLDFSRVAVFGTTAGELVRTTDACATGAVVYTVPGGPRVEFVWKDVDLLLIWWASTVDGRIYRSADDGVTWSLYHNFGDGYPVYRLATPNAGPYRGWLFAYGGNTAVPSSLIRYDAGKTGAWTSVPIGGLLAAAISLAGAGYSVQEAASAESDDLAIIFTAGVSPVHWYNPNFQDGEGWVAAIGLAAGAGEALAPGYMGAGDLLAVIASLTTYSASDGETFVAGANPTPSQVNHLFWETGQFGVYIGAAAGGIVKTVDHGETWGYIRPLGVVTWPAGAVGYMISFEAEPLQPATADLYVVSDLTYERLTVGDAWEVKDGAAPNVASGLIRYISNGLMFHLERRVCSPGAGQGLYRSIDYGESWAEVAPPSADHGCVWYDVAPGGRLWAVWWNNSNNHAEVWRSDDDGDNWTLSYDRGSAFRWIANVHVDPGNENNLVLGVDDAIGQAAPCVVSTDGGATWTLKTPLGGAMAACDTRVWWGLGGRLICQLVGVFFGGVNIITSDDYGDSWTLRLTVGHNDADVGEIVRAGGASAPNYFSYGHNDVGVSEHLHRSQDNGETWESLNLPAGPDWTSETIQALAYDILTDRLYLLSSGATYTTEVWYLEAATAVAVGSESWVELPSTGLTPSILGCMTLIVS